MKIVYHGSQKSGTKVFTPLPNKAVKDKEVVFAFVDKAFAIATIPGTMKELAVSYFGDGEIYLDELQEGKLDLLNNSGYVYELDGSLFEESPEKIDDFLVSYSEVQTLKEEKIENIRETLVSLGVHLIPYNQLAQSMQERGKVPNQCREGSRNLKSVGKATDTPV